MSSTRNSYADGGFDYIYSPSHTIDTPHSGTYSTYTPTRDDDVYSEAAAMLGQLYNPKGCEASAQTHDDALIARETACPNGIPSAISATGSETNGVHRPVSGPIPSSSPDNLRFQELYGGDDRANMTPGMQTHHTQSKAQIIETMAAIDHNRNRYNNGAGSDDRNGMRSVGVSSATNIPLPPTYNRPPYTQQPLLQQHPRQPQQQQHPRQPQQQQFTYAPPDSSTIMPGPYIHTRAYPPPDTPYFGHALLPHPQYNTYTAPQAYAQSPVVMVGQHAGPPYTYLHPNGVPNNGSWQNAHIHAPAQAQQHTPTHAYAQDQGDVQRHAHAQAQADAQLNAAARTTLRSESQSRLRAGFQPETVERSHVHVKVSEVHKTLGDFLPEHVLKDTKDEDACVPADLKDMERHRDSRRIDTGSSVTGDVDTGIAASVISTAGNDVGKGYDKTALRGARPYTIGSSKIGLPSRNTAVWKQHMTEGISTLLPDIVLPSDSRDLPGVRVCGDLNFGTFNVVPDADTDTDTAKHVADGIGSVTKQKNGKGATLSSTVESNPKLDWKSGAGRGKRSPMVHVRDDMDSTRQEGRANGVNRDQNGMQCAKENRVVSIENATDSKIYLADIVFTPPCSVFVVTDTNALQWVKPAKDFADSVGSSCLVIPPHSSYDFLVGCLPGGDVGIYQQYIVIALVVGDTTAEQPTIEYLGSKTTCMMQHADDVALLDADAMPFFPLWMTTLFDTQANLVVGPTLPLPIPRCMTTKTTAMVAREMHRTVLSISAPSAAPTTLVVPQTSRSISAPTASEYNRQVDVVDTLLSALVCEEDRHAIDINGFDLYRHKVTNTMLAGKQLIVTFKVPSLLERRPEILFGHTVRIREELSMHKKELLATVFKVTRDLIQVLVFKKHHKMFQKKCRLFLRFMVDHQPFKVMAFTLQCVRAKGLWLEEGENRHKCEYIRQESLQRLSDHSSSAIESRAECVEGLNTEQREAATGIADCCEGDVYLVHGPPGTGKTTAVISATRLVISSGQKVLLCAPSHAAADVLVQRLAECVPNPRETILRLYPYQRDYSNVPMDVKPYAHFDAVAGMFVCPPPEVLMARSIIVCTCLSAAILADVPSLRGTLSHIIIDEAAQATEPEVLVPISAVGAKTTRVALIGDHKQLGPVVRSADARRMGLHVSPLERLCKLHADGDASSLNRRILLTQLTKNYRSHETLLELPSKLFYNNSLEACSENATDQSLLAWEELPTKAPLLFYGVAGHYHQDGDSRSYFNDTEASLVSTIVQKLLQYKPGSVSTNDIGIIAPFRKQVYNIRTLLRAHGLGAIRVGTVQDYQGQEEKIIFISTVIGRNVRTKSQILKGFGSGLTGNARRFNVAITRAKSLLVVVGDPLPLVGDPYWMKFISHCIQNKTYKGCPCPVIPGVETSTTHEPANVDALIERMGALMLGPGDESLMFPDPEDLASFYRDEQEFRCLV